MTASDTMIIRLMNKVGTMTEIIKVVLFSDFTMVFFVSVVVNLLILGTVDDTLYWVMLLWLDSTKIVVLFENGAMLVEGVCISEVNVDFILVLVLIDGDGEQETFARK